MLCVAAGLVVLLMMYRMRFDQVRNRLQGRLEERMLERERIARELHDTLIQGFQGLVLLFGAAMQRVPRDHPSQELMSRALVRADAVLAEARDRVSGLRSSLGLRDDLPSALNDLGHELFHQQPPVFTVTLSGSPRPLHAVVFEETYQIVREALTNAQRHANATHVRLELTFGRFRLHLRVHDDGRAIDPQVLEHNGIPGHWGMRGMRERARKIGAKLYVRSAPGFGTEIDLQIPAAVAFREYRSRWWRPPFIRFGIDHHEQ
jgi:signal transduction histidine kinase